MHGKAFHARVDSRAASWGRTMIAGGTGGKRIFAEGEGDQAVLTSVKVFVGVYGEGEGAFLRARGIGQPSKIHPHLSILRNQRL